MITPVIAGHLLTLVIMKGTTHLLTEVNHHIAAVIFGYVQTVDPD